MKLLVTGSRGFLGQSVGALATRTGHTVLGVARSSQPARDWCGGHFQADVAQADLADIIADFAPDAILHAAGAASVGASLLHPLDDLRGSVQTWANLLDGVRRSGLRPLVLFPSSAAVYGNPTSLPVAENAVTMPVSPYGFHKKMCELLAQEFAECFSVRIIVCRLFSIIGTAQRRLLLWEIFSQAREDSDAIQLEGTGEESRDYLHIDDVARALLGLAATNPAPSYSVVNIASGLETTALEMAEQTRALIAPSKSILCRSHERPGNPKRWRGDNALLRSLLPNWQAQSVDAAVRECINEWSQAHVT